MKTNKKIQYIFYFGLMTVIPFLLWVVSNYIIQSVTLFLIGILFIFSKYIKNVKFLNDTLEIIFLFLLIIFLFNRIGLDNLFPLNHVISIILLYFFLCHVKKISPSKLYLKIGNIKQTVWMSMIIILCSVIGLSVWFILQKDNPYAEMIPKAPTILLILMGIGFAIINSIYEEGIFRSILFSHFSKEMGLISALILQSIWFSFLHYQAGFPSGEIGIILTFIFGLIMGYLVHRTNGILIPVIIHAVADFSVFLLVVFRIKGLI